jgi:argininosuccinate lyase
MAWYLYALMPDSQRRLLAGRTPGGPSDLLLQLSGSASVDLPLAAFDIEASRAHVAELEHLGLLDAGGRETLDRALRSVGDRIAGGTFAWSARDEDIHLNVEAALRDEVGAGLAGQLQAGRSRNEEIVTDERLWLRGAVAELDGLLLSLQRTLVRRAAEELETVLPAHTHTQPAQPVLLAHHLLAYLDMLDRDRGRLADLASRADRCPAGSGAAVGSGLPIDRQRVAERLGFSAPTGNSLDAVADRDYAVELVAACAIAAGHLSRLAGELVLWVTPYLGFARLADGFVSGSSMLPNKRNPDAAELVRARAARCQAAVTSLLALTDGLPLGYHRDFQETRGPMLEAASSLALSISAMDAMLVDVIFDRGAMRRAATAGHALAASLAERLVTAGVPFRPAHGRVGELVARAEARALDVTELPDAELRAALPELADRPAIVPTVEEALAAADVIGGTAPGRVRGAVQAAAERLGVAFEMVAGAGA